MTMTRSVIDILHWKEPIDFEEVAGDRIIAVIAKATQGAAELDSAYAKFKRAAAPRALGSLFDFETARKIA